MPFRRPLFLLVLPLVLAPATVASAGQTPPKAEGSKVLLKSTALAAIEAPPEPNAVPTDPQLQPQGFTYEPDGRRDPFVSLLRRGVDVQNPTLGSRPGGLAGLETGEVTLKGTIESQAGYVAIVQGVDSKTYIVKAGDRLLDGAVRAITYDSMVIMQQVNDPLSLEKQREVRKALRQTEEAK